VQLQFNGQFIVGDDDYDFGMSDLALVTDDNGDLMLVGVTSGSGGVVAWGMSNLGTPAFSTMYASSTEFASSTGPSIVSLDQSNGETNANGGVTSLSSSNVQSENWTTGVQLDNGLIALADAQGSGFSLFTQSGNGLSLDDTISDTNATHATAITAMATMGDILLIASATEYGISSYDTSTASTTAVTSFGTDSGIGMMTPTALLTVQIDGQAFAIMATAQGASGALSVFSIGSDGSLVPTDHLMDTLDSRFGAVQDSPRLRTL